MSPTPHGETSVIVTANAALRIRGCQPVDWEPLRAAPAVALFFHEQFEEASAVDGLVELRAAAGSLAPLDGAADNHSFRKLDPYAFADLERNLGDQHHPGVRDVCRK